MGGLKRGEDAMIRHADDRPQHARSGLTSVLMLIGLLVLGIIAANLLRVERSRLDRARAEERLLQVEALADAGIDRALAQLRADARFEGEAWEPTADDLPGVGRARVTITVRPDPAGPAGSRLIVVAAELVPAPGRSIRLSRSLPWRPDATQL